MRGLPRKWAPTAFTLSLLASIGLLLALALLLSGCALRQAYPNLSPVGRVLVSVRTVDGIAAAIQQRTEALATAGTITPMQARPVIEATGMIGDASATIGRLFSSYLAATDAVAKAKIKDNLLAAMLALERAAAGINLDAIKGDTRTLREDINRLRTAIQEAS